MSRVRGTILGVIVAVGVSLAQPASAATVGIFVNDGNGASAAAGAATVAANLGLTPVILPGLTAADLGGVNVLWLFNGDNVGYGAEINAHIGDLANFVAAGGVLSFDDRTVAEGLNGAASASDVLPGGSGISLTRLLGADINVEATAPALITNGPGGVVNDTTLDNGNFSDHGYAAIGSLPAGAVPVLNNGVAGNLVDFYYAYGAGTVYYSTIPLDFYLAGAPPANFANIYAPNELAFQASLSAVPEPATLLLLGAGLVGVARSRRKSA